MHIIESITSQRYVGRLLSPPSLAGHAEQAGAGRRPAETRQADGGVRSSMLTPHARSHMHVLRNLTADYTFVSFPAA